MFVQGMVADAHISENRNKKNKKKLLEWMYEEKEKSFHKFWGKSALLCCGKGIVFAALIEQCWKILVSGSVSELIIFAVLKSLVRSVLLIKLFILSKVSAMSTCWGVLPWLSTFQPLIQWPRIICWTADLGTLSKTTLRIFSVKGGGTPQFR